MATESTAIPAYELEAILNRAALDTSVIKAADLKGMALNYTYEETVHEVTDTVKRNAGTPIHADLRRAFYALSVHMAVIIEDIPAEAIHEAGDIDALTNVPEYTEDGDRIFNSPLEEKISKYDVDGISISKAGVVLSGTCELSTKDRVDITTPRIKWEESQYPFLMELMAAVETMKDEIRLYKNGKSAPVAHQGDLFDEEMAAA